MGRLLGRTEIAETSKFPFHSSETWMIIRPDFGIVRDDRPQAGGTGTRKSGKKYRSIFRKRHGRNLPDTPGGRFLQANLQWRESMATTPLIISEHSVTDIAKQVYVNPDDRKYLKEILEKNDHIEKNEYQVRRKKWR